MASISFTKDLPTDDNDIFGGTVLETIPGPGTLLVWFASSQRDGIMDVQSVAFDGLGAYRIAPLLRTNGIPLLSDDPPQVFQCVQAGKLQGRYDEVTAGDAAIAATFIED